MGEGKTCVGSPLPSNVLSQIRKADKMWLCRVKRKMLAKQSQRRLRCETPPPPRKCLTASNKRAHGPGAQTQTRLLNMGSCFLWEEALWTVIGCRASAPGLPDPGWHLPRHRQLSPASHFLTMSPEDGMVLSSFWPFFFAPAFFPSSRSDSATIAFSPERQTSETRGGWFQFRDPHCRPFSVVQIGRLTSCQRVERCHLPALPL